MIEVKIKGIYEGFINNLKKDFEISNIDINKNKVILQMVNMVEEVERFKIDDPLWATKERITDYIRTIIIPTSSLKIKLKEKDIISMYLEKWNLDRNSIIRENLNKYPLVCYRSGKFIKDFFDYKYNLEFEEFENENIFYKKLYLILPYDLEKTNELSLIFGNEKYKYKKVVLNVINNFYSEKLKKLRQDVEELFYDLTELLCSELISN